MHALTAYIIPVALAAVAHRALAGLWNMMRGGSPNTSQLLMRWRVVLAVRRALPRHGGHLSGRTSDVQPVTKA